MKQIMLGQRLKLSDLTTSKVIQIGVFVAGSTGQVFDLSCFGVDSNNQLLDDRYFIFYNQKASPEGALRIIGGQNGDLETFLIGFPQLPKTIQKLVFTISLDSPGTMSQISQGYLRLMDGDVEQARFSFSGRDFKAERAVIVAEIYFKEVWRFAAVGQGYDGGLSDLLKHFGGQEATNETLPAPLPPVTLEPSPP
ncbi:MAG: TerD family protein, partial [Chloroflexota bacterium]